MLKHITGLAINPKQEWQKISEAHYSIKTLYLSYFIFVAAIPPICLYFGVTKFGWSIAGIEFVKIDAASALPLAIVLYFALLVGLVGMSLMMRWMQGTYDSNAPAGSFCALTMFSTTPLILFGATMIYPLVWVNLLVGLLAVSYAVYLFYLGMPIMAKIPESKGFLFSSAMVTLWLCALVVIIVVAVFLTTTIFEPVITR